MVPPDLIPKTRLKHHQITAWWLERVMPPQTMTPHSTTAHSMRRSTEYVVTNHGAPSEGSRTHPWIYTACFCRPGHANSWLCLAQQRFRVRATFPAGLMGNPFQLEQTSKAVGLTIVAVHQTSGGNVCHCIVTCSIGVVWKLQEV